MQYRFTLRINRVPFIDVLSCIEELGYEDTNISRDKGYALVTFNVESTDSCINEIKNKITEMRSVLGDKAEIVQKTVRE